MPVQHTIFGRPVSLRMPPRRIQVVLFLVFLCASGILLFGAPTSVDVPSVQQISDAVKNPKLPSVPKLPNPFRPSAHEPPPVQANSTDGKAKWYSDWTWRNPWSISITLDENRAVLPPLVKRTPVYTFYELDTKKDKAVLKAENQLLLTWRRAWWAKGFKPVVLGRPEAEHNPLYRLLQTKKLKPALERDVTRWLAWGSMGSGILSNYLAVPMAAYEDPLLSYLRRGDFPKLTRFEGLNSGLFYGPQNAISDVIKIALDNPDLEKELSLTSAVPADALAVDNQGASIAYYEPAVINTKYKAVADALGSPPSAAGLTALQQLINAHLQTTWQNTFSAGISIVKPGKHMSALVAPAIDIARNLTACAASPIPFSCPPNLPKCHPCNPSHHLLISTLPVFRNSTEELFSIGTVPHPYTFASLHHQKDVLDPRYIRRDLKDRDPWLALTTKELLGTAVSAATRVVRFKDAVAAEHGQAHSLWLTAERESHEDLDWIFGFELPRDHVRDGKSETPVPGPERRPKVKEENEDAAKPTEAELEVERRLLQKARSAINSKVKQQIVVKEAVEAWSLADTEAWRFARAWSARRRVERRKWEEEEKEFAGAEGGRGGGRWGRWFERGR